MKTLRAEVKAIVTVAIVIPLILALIDDEKDVKRSDTTHSRRSICRRLRIDFSFVLFLVESVRKN